MGILLSNVSNSPPTVDEVETILAAFKPANHNLRNASLEVVQSLRAAIATSSSTEEGAEIPLLCAPSARSVGVLESHAIVNELILTRDEICLVLKETVPRWEKRHLMDSFLIRRSIPEEVELKTRKGALLKAPQMRYVITRLKYLELGAESATSEFDADLWQVLDSLYLVICTSYASSYPHIHWPNFYSLLLTTHYSPPLLNLSAYCVLLTTYSSLWIPTTPPTIGRCSRRERPRWVYCYRMSQTALRQ